MAAADKKSKIEIGQWVYIGQGEFPIKAQVIESRGFVGYDREPAFLLLIPPHDVPVHGELDEEARTRVAVESRLTPV
jgi:hypothetical protein